MKDFLLKRRYLKNIRQLELGIERPLERDRNILFGGRSVYLFDFDDNVAYLPTPMILFHKDTGHEVQVSTAEWSYYHDKVGKKGPFKNYTIDLCAKKGSYRCFRDTSFTKLDRYLLRRKQPFVSDMLKALREPDLNWKGPSWDCFYHAVYNQRPLSIITARGHSKDTIKEGIRVMVKYSYLPYEPNYLDIFPVSNPEVKAELGDPEEKLSVPELKKKAIRASVEAAVSRFGDSAPHRFGMSDDDKKNLASILEEMKDLKKDYPNMSFFVISISGSSYVKKEVILPEIKRKPREPNYRAHQQLDMFSSKLD